MRFHKKHLCVCGLVFPDFALGLSRARAARDLGPWLKDGFWSRWLAKQVMRVIQPVAGPGRLDTYHV